VARILVGATIYLISLSANSWTINGSYDSQQVGDRCKNWSSTGSVVTDIKSYSGDKSCLQHIDEGKTGFGQWGGIINHPSALKKGDEIWVRIRTFMPSGFNYDSTSGGSRLKFLRVHVRDASSDNLGYNDWYINPKGGGTPFRFIYEEEQVWSNVGTSDDAIKLGQWETYEYYIKFDNVSVDNGRQARVRFWKNGELLNDITDRMTLKNSSAYSDRTHVFTYWNGGSPATQDMYVDDLVITSDTPGKRDANGNPYIGVGSRIADPNPPSWP